MAHDRPIDDGDAGALLAAMLKRVERVVGEMRRVGMVPDAEDAALLMPVVNSVSSDISCSWLSSASPTVWLLPIAAVSAATDARNSYVSERSPAEALKHLLRAHATEDDAGNLVCPRALFDRRLDRPSRASTTMRDPPSPKERQIGAPRNVPCEIRAKIACDAHLRQRHRQPAIGDIMRRANPSSLDRFAADELDERLQAQVNRGRRAKRPASAQHDVLAPAQGLGWRAEDHEDIARLFQRNGRQMADVVHNAHHADDRRGVDVLAVGLVVEADIATHHWGIKRSARLGDPGDALDELVEDVRGFSGLPKFRQSVTASGRAPAQVRLRAASATACMPPARGSR